MRRNLLLFATLSITALACGSSGAELQTGPREWEAERIRMVNEQLRARDIRSARVLEAMLKVPRHLFIPESERAQAYKDSPLPIGHGQTISQPYIVAFMTQELKVEPDDRGTRDRNWIGLPGGRPRCARERGVHDPDRRDSRGTGTRDVNGCRLSQYSGAYRQRVPRLARTRAVRPYHGNGAPAEVDRPRWCNS